MDGAVGGGAFAALTIVSIVGRYAILGARRQARHKESERRHQEAVAARGARSAPPSPRQAPARTAGPADAIPENAVTEAARHVIGAQYATATFLQRKMRVERATALRLMDELERRGVIGPQRGTQPRDVRVPRGAR